MKDPRTIYFDESGFTGYNLLDTSQPVFVLGSTDLPPAESQKLLRTAFPRYQGVEFKSTNVWKSRDRESLLRLGSSVAQLEEHFFFYTCDKAY